MAHVVNPFNLDDGDDAVFSALLSQGLIWIEEDNEDDEYDIDDVLEEACDFIHGCDEEWVNFSRLCKHLHETFHNLDPRRLGQSNKKYKSLLRLFEDYPSDFDLRSDDEKQSVHFIRLKRAY